MPTHLQAEGRQLLADFRYRVSAHTKLILVAGADPVETYVGWWWAREGGGYRVVFNDYAAFVVPRERPLPRSKAELKPIYKLRPAEWIRGVAPVVRQAAEDSLHRIDEVDYQARMNALRTPEKTKWWELLNDTDWMVAALTRAEEQSGFQRHS